MHLHVPCRVTYNSQDLEASQVPISIEWIKKVWYLYSMECYLAIRKEILPSATGWMALEGIMVK